MAYIKPCPLCGSTAKLWKSDSGFRVDCSNFSAGHMVGIEALTEAEAVHAWNDRPEAIPIEYIEQDLQECRRNGLDTYVGFIEAMVWFWRKHEKDKNGSADKR